MVHTLLIVAIVATGVAICSVGIGIIIGHFAISKPTTNISWKFDSNSQQSAPQHYKTFLDLIQANSIEAYLKDSIVGPRLAGTPEDLETARAIEKRWKNDGLEVTKLKYNVLLSYPDENNPNKVTLTNGDGTVILQTAGIEKVYDPRQPKTVNPFLAYTPNGTVSSRKLFYANYGRPEDFQNLAAEVGNASLQGSIIIMKYTRIYRGSKIMLAQSYGAIGAILYGDPIDFAPFGTTPDQVYDRKWNLPPSGVQRGSSYTSSGDALTPIYPATDYMHRIKPEDVSFFPKIVAQPIGYSEAQVLLGYMQGKEVNMEWRGNLSNVTYRYGGELPNSASVQIRSYNRYKRRDTYNVIGMMRGEVEPDRYIVIGNHRDAWSLGSVDSCSGEAILMEITHALGQMYKNGFRPKRTLMFCSWGAEEYGLVGSVEYVQEFVKVLGSRVIAYLNMDSPIIRTDKLCAYGSPLLFDVIVEAAKLVQSPYDPPGQSVYDKWMKVYRNPLLNEPEIHYGLGSTSDYFAFNQLVGSSNFDLYCPFSEVDNVEIDWYPLYHTSYETFALVKNFIDPTFAAHRSVGQLMGILGLLLSETTVLPLNATRYTVALKQVMHDMQNRGLHSTILQDAIYDFEKVANDFTSRSKSVNIENPYEVRAYNDQLLQLERAFLNPLGQGANYTDLKHIVYAPAKGNKYAAAGFPSVSDALASGDQNRLNQEIATVVYFIRGALSTLKQYDKFMS